MSMAASTKQCPECNSGMDELEPDYETLSEGQQAEYDAGFRKYYGCPKCNTVGIFEGDGLDADPIDDVDDENGMPKVSSLWTLSDCSTPNIESQDLHAKYNLVRGDISEYLVRKKYEQVGYIVVKVIIQPNREHLLNKKELGPICNAFKNKKLYDFLKKQEISGLPDFLCINMKKAFFVESKPRIEKVKEHQQRVFEKFKLNGYAVFVCCTPIKLDVTFDTQEVYCLK